MLAALVEYYDQLLSRYPSEIPTIGWCTANVAYIAQISQTGELENIIPVVDRKKMKRKVPQQQKRASGIAANFLCDKAEYVFGVCNQKDTNPDKKKKAIVRAAQCFEASRNLHRQILGECESPCAKALLAFFELWQTDAAVEHPALLAAGDKILAGGNIEFAVNVEGEFVNCLDDDEIHRAWDWYLQTPSDDSECMRCLVTGELTQPARLHPSIKGVYGAQSSGASLVSFNAPAFESYGHDKEQGRNAPVSETAAQAYGIALNYLLSNPDHHLRIGDTTVVYWSEKQDQNNSALMSMMLGGWAEAFADASSNDTDAIVGAALKAVVRGEYRDLDGIDIDATFYVLGLAPSAARLSVKFFFKSSFGTMLDNVGKHYRLIDIVHAPYEREYLTPYQLLKEVEPPKAKKPVVAPVLAGPLLRSILEGLPYPQSLYANCLMRVHATQEDKDNNAKKVTRGRAAIIRAYLIRNCRRNAYDEEGLTVALNEERNETAYCLGRAFSILERIQEGANNQVTITNRYFNAASTTPAVVYPQLIRLAESHLTKMKRSKPGYAVVLEKKLGEVLSEQRVTHFPKRLSQEEQGDFMLGYVHQRNSWYAKKNDNVNN